MNRLTREVVATHELSLVCRRETPTFAERRRLVARFVSNAVRQNAAMIEGLR
jgi:hypothetical protein